MIDLNKGATRSIDDPRGGVLEDRIDGLLLAAVRHIDDTEYLCDIQGASSIFSKVATAIQMAGFEIDIGVRAVSEPYLNDTWMLGIIRGGAFDMPFPFLCVLQVDRRIQRYSDDTLTAISNFRTVQWANHRYGMKNPAMVIVSDLKAKLIKTIFVE